MNMRKVNFFIITASLLFGSCSTSYITTSWKADDAAAKQYKKILVLGLIGDPDRSIRDRMEEHLAGDLKDLGYNAVTSVSVYGPKAFENTSEGEAIKLLNNQGFDAVVTIVLLDKSKEKYYLPGKINYSPYAVQHNRFWGYYSAMNGRINSPGYYSIDTRYFWESNLFELSGSQLTYSVQSQSFDPESAQKLGHEYGLMIVKDMVKQNVLHAQTAPVLKSF
jgi:hypothetical protein